MRDFGPQAARDRCGQPGQPFRCRIGGVAGPRRGRGRHGGMRLVEQRTGVAAETDRAVDEQAAARRLEMLEHFRDHDGLVP